MFSTVMEKNILYVIKKKINTFYAKEGKKYARTKTENLSVVALNAYFMFSFVFSERIILFELLIHK